MEQPRDILTRLKEGERITFKQDSKQRTYHHNKTGYHATFVIDGEIVAWEYLPTDEDMRVAINHYQKTNWGVLYDN